MKLIVVVFIEIWYLKSILFLFCRIVLLEYGRCEKLKLWLYSGYFECVFYYFFEIFGKMGNFKIGEWGFCILYFW